MALSAFTVVTVPLVLLIVCTDFTLCKNAHPAKVQIYTRSPGHVGKDNILICHASLFHPPELNLDLLMDGKPMAANQTELTFEESWYYQLTKHANFIPEKGRVYSCKVTHLGKESTYAWEPDM